MSAVLLVTALLAQVPPQSLGVPSPDGSGQATRDEFAGFDLGSPDGVIAAFRDTMKRYREMGRDHDAMLKVALRLERLQEVLQSAAGFEEKDRERYLRIIDSRLPELNEKLGRESPERPSARRDAIRSPSEDLGDRKPGNNQADPLGWRRGWQWNGNGRMPGGSWQAFSFGEMWAWGQGEAQQQGPELDSARDRFGNPSGDPRAKGEARKGAQMRPQPGFPGFPGAEGPATFEQWRQLMQRMPAGLQPPAELFPPKEKVRVRDEEFKLDGNRQK